jgi:Ca-activated chloride channel homolog
VTIAAFQAFHMRLIAFLAVVSLASIPPSLAQDVSPSFVSGSTEIVVLPATVTDKRGTFVTNLARDRFAVFDNGRRQEISFFSAEDLPVTVGLVLDSSGSMAGKLPEVVTATLALARSSNPDDEFFVVAFNDTVQEQRADRLTVVSDTAALESQLRSLTAGGRTALYDALMLGLKRAARGTRARKALIVVSDGGDNASHVTLDRVLADARRSNVMIFTIGLFDVQDPDQDPRVLKSLAQSTGGERFMPKSSALLLRACERIARDLRTGYTLGYVPPDRDGVYHRVRVQVERVEGDKLVVRTRPGYFAARQEAARQ